MLQFLLSLLLSFLCAYAAHESVRLGNMKWRELDMSPNFSAIIAFIFGVTGLIVLAMYGAIKVMFKRMLKH